MTVSAGKTLHPTAAKVSLMYVAFGLLGSHRGTSKGRLLIGLCLVTAAATVVGLCVVTLHTADSAATSGQIFAMARCTRLEVPRGVLKELAMKAFASRQMNV